MTPVLEKNTDTLKDTESPNVAPAGLGSTAKSPTESSSSPHCLGLASTEQVSLGLCHTPAPATVALPPRGAEFAVVVPEPSLSRRCRSRLGANGGEEAQALQYSTARSAMSLALSAELHSRTCSHQKKHSPLESKWRRRRNGEKG